MKNEKLDVDKFWRIFGIIVFSVWFTFGAVCAMWISRINHKETNQIEQEYPIENSLEPETLGDGGYFKVTATVYNPEVGQCDDSPLITADQSRIDLDKLSSGSLKWVALSRDLLQHFNYGDLVMLLCENDPSINGIYEVHDTMNQRYSNYIDILMPSSRRLGKWDDVYIKKVEG